jgi:hypothetical protein
MCDAHSRYAGVRFRSRILAIREIRVINLFALRSGYARLGIRLSNLGPG